MARIKAIAGFATLLVGCAQAPMQPPLPPPTGDASWKPVIPEGTARYQLAMARCPAVRHRTIASILSILRRC